MKLLPLAVGDAPELNLQLILEAGKLSESDQLGGVDLHAPVALSVGKERTRKYHGIPSIVLRSCNVKAAAKTIYLFGIDREHGKASFDQGFHEGTPGDLDADRDQSWLTRGSLFKFVDQGYEAFAAVVCVVLLYGSPGTFQHGNAVSLRSPVDSDKLLKRLLHDRSPGLLCDALVTPVPALTPGSGGATPHWTFASLLNRQGASPRLVIESLRYGGTLDG